MARLYSRTEILPGDFAMQISKAYTDREASDRALRRQAMEDLGQLLRLGGQSYDAYRRYKEFDDSALLKEKEKLGGELKDINQQLLMLNNQIRSIEDAYRANDDYQMGELYSEPSDIVPPTSYGTEDYSGRF